MYRIFAALFCATLITLVAAGTSAAQQKKQPPPRVHWEKDPSHKILRAPSGASLYIEAVGEDRSTFSMLLSDENNRTVAGNFRREQIDIFEALMVEAKKFAESEEAAGLPGKSRTTRFMDKNEKSFFVDVQKAGVESRFYITLKTLEGIITVDMGAIRRGSKKDSPLFFTALARVQSATGDGSSPK
jgi:hypothetical protein